MLKQLVTYWYMGGYGIYVWPCYVALLAIVSWLLVDAVKKNMLIHNKIKQDLWYRSNSDKQT